MCYYHLHCYYYHFHHHHCPYHHFATTHALIDWLLWGETTSLNCGCQRACCLSPRLYISKESHGGMILTGENRRTLRKTCPSATLSATNPTCIDPGLLCAATNRLSHGTTKLVRYYHNNCSS
jgi:hypothetical protein